MAQETGEYSSGKCKYPPLRFDIPDGLFGSKKKSAIKFEPLRIDHEEEYKKLTADIDSSSKNTQKSSQSHGKYVASSSKNIHKSTVHKRKSLPKSKVRKSLFNSKEKGKLCAASSQIPKTLRVEKSRKSINSNKKKKESPGLFQFHEELLATEIKSENESIINTSNTSSEFLLLEEKCGITSSNDNFSPKLSFDCIRNEMEKDLLEFEKKQRELLKTIETNITEFSEKYRSNLTKLQSLKETSQGGKENLSGTSNFASPVRILRSAAKPNTLREKILNRNLTKNLSQRSFNILKSDCESTSSLQIQKQCFSLMETPSRK